MSANKPKVIKDFEKCTEEMQEALYEMYPDGFHQHLVKFADKDGKYVHAVPYETEDRYYLIKLPNLVAPKPSKDADLGPDDALSAGENDSQDSSDKYTDLDTMQVGSGRKKDEDEDYD
jgi:hypothetical protein